MCVHAFVLYISALCHYYAVLLLSDWLLRSSAVCLQYSLKYIHCMGIRCCFKDILLHGKHFKEVLKTLFGEIQIFTKIKHITYFVKVTMCVLNSFALYILFHSVRKYRINGTIVKYCSKLKFYFLNEDNCLLCLIIN